jgi:hypothetical protein
LVPDQKGVDLSFSSDEDPDLASCFKGKVRQVASQLNRNDLVPLDFPSTDPLKPLDLSWF